MHVGAGQGEVQAGGDGQRRLVHAADHHLEAGGARHRVDLQRLGDAADLHQLDVDHVGQVAAGQAEGVAQGHQALVGHDRAGGRRAVTRPSRSGSSRGVGCSSSSSFAPARAPPRRPGSAPRCSPGWRRSAARSSGPTASRTLSTRATSSSTSRPPLSLRQRKPWRDEVARPGHGLVRGQDADGDAGADARAVAAEQPPQRAARRPGPGGRAERHVDGGQGRRAVGQQRLRRCSSSGRGRRGSWPCSAAATVALRARPGSSSGVSPVTGGRARRSRSPRSRAGLQAQEDVGGLAHRLVGDGVGLGQGHVDAPGLDRA